MMTLNEPVKASQRHCCDATVTGNLQVSRLYWLMQVAAPEIARAAVPGQFVQLRASPRADASRMSCDPLLPRPFAVYGVAGDEVQILYVPVGRGTARMQGLRPGDRIQLLGPLGRSFWIPEEADALVAIGGGTGLAALRYLFAATPKGERERRLLLGAREGGIHLPADVLDLPDVSVGYSSDDGSGGCFHGTCVMLAEQVLGDLGSRRTQVYAAGPLPMLQATWALCRSRGIPCQVSLEAVMACGVGVCRSCVVDMRQADPETGLRRRAMCTEGPVFDAAEVDWDSVARAHA